MALSIMVGHQMCRESTLGARRGEMREAIRYHIESLREHHEPVPEPRCTAPFVDVAPLAR